MKVYALMKKFSSLGFWTLSWILPVWNKNKLKYSGYQAWFSRPNRNKNKNLGFCQFESQQLFWGLCCCKNLAVPCPVSLRGLKVRVLQYMEKSRNSSRKMNIFADCKWLRHGRLESDKNVVQLPLYVLVSIFSQYFASFGLLFASRLIMLTKICLASTMPIVSASVTVHL